MKKTRKPGEGMDHTDWENERMSMPQYQKTPGNEIAYKQIMQTINTVKINWLLTDGDIRQLLLEIIKEM